VAGLSEYLPMSEADFKTRSAELLGTAQESQSEIEALTAELNAAKGKSDRFKAPIESKLNEAQEDLNAAQQELQTIIDTARTAGGVNSSVVNNVQSQSDAIFMPNSGSIDNDDIRVR
jgi:Skp family chaperone for outer membrane proteins